MKQCCKKRTNNLSLREESPFSMQSKKLRHHDFSFKNPSQKISIEFNVQICTSMHKFEHTVQVAPSDASPGCAFKKTTTSVCCATKASTQQFPLIHTR